MQKATSNSIPQRAIKSIGKAERERERESGTTDGRFAREVIDDQKSFLKSMPAAFSDSHPNLNVILGRAKPVLHGPNSTHSNLFHHGETTFRAG